MRKLLFRFGVWIMRLSAPSPAFLQIIIFPLPVTYQQLHAAFEEIRDAAIKQIAESVGLGKGGE